MFFRSRNHCWERPIVMGEWIQIVDLIAADISHTCLKRPLESLCREGPKIREKPESLSHRNYSQPTFLFLRFPSRMSGTQEFILRMDNLSMPQVVAAGQ